MIRKIFSPQPPDAADDSAPPHCTPCDKTMNVTQRGPLLFAGDFDRIGYACSKCGAEESRTVRRQP